MASGIANREEFKRQIRIDLIDATREDVVNTQRLLGLHALNGVVENTPVDRGDARGAWQASIGSPSTELGTRDADGGATKARGAAVLDRLDPKQRFVEVFITNNQPHAEVLDLGLFVPPDPSEDPAARKKRKWSRSLAKRAEAQAKLGDEGASFVKGGFSIKAPIGIVDIVMDQIEQGFA